jgi:hypothetical protein
MLSCGYRLPCNNLYFSSGGETLIGWWISPWIVQRLKTDGLMSKLTSPNSVSSLEYRLLVKYKQVESHFRSFHVVTMQHLDGRLTSRNRLAPARELTFNRLIRVPRTTWPVAATSTDSVLATTAVRSMPFNRWLRFSSSLTKFITQSLAFCYANSCQNTLIGHLKSERITLHCFSRVVRIYLSSTSNMPLHYQFIAMSFVTFQYIKTLRNIPSTIATKLDEQPTHLIGKQT